MVKDLRAIRGDIAQLDVEAVVNAANATLLGGGGVDGAIHYAAGPGSLARCRELGGCPTGQARITSGFNLKARWIIHTVGPVWKGGDKGEAELLASCYRESLRLVSMHSIQTIAFPAISTGAYAYPLRLATEIAISTVTEYVERHQGELNVLFCCYSGEDYATYTRALRRAIA